MIAMGLFGSGPAAIPGLGRGAFPASPLWKAGNADPCRLHNLGQGVGRPPVTDRVSPIT